MLTARSLFISILFFAAGARAEYRAYHLAITDTTTQSTRTLYSTLDQYQYMGYYPLKLTETIAIKDTWMCWGRHGDFAPICPSPRAEGAAAPSARTPASRPASAPAR